MPGGIKAHRGLQALAQRLALLRLKGIQQVGGPWLKVTDSLQQPPVKVGLSQKPGQLEPPTALPGRQGQAPLSTIRALFAQGGHRPLLELLCQMLECGDNLGAIVLRGDDLGNDARLAHLDGVLGKRAGRGNHEGFWQHDMPFSVLSLGIIPTPLAVCQPL